jgi:hypothetical protein
MAAKSRKDTVEALLDRYGQTYCDEIGIDIAKNTPAPLFRWLVASILYSTRISAERATQAARALGEAGLTTPETMAEASWQERVDVLTNNGFKRYDESMSTTLGEVAETVLDDYKGDLCRLRDAAGRNPAEEQKLLKKIKGLGPIGVSIFCREAQDAWDELRPFADKKALKAAGRLGLPEDAEGLAGLVPKKDFTPLVAALVRVDLARDYDDITG